jgi:hypothetical protein
MRRREFIGILGTTALCPLAARAQQPVKPVVGFLKSEEPRRARFFKPHFALG